MSTVLNPDLYLFFHTEPPGSDNTASRLPKKIHKQQLMMMMMIQTHAGYSKVIMAASK